MNPFSRVRLRGSRLVSTGIALLLMQSTSVHRQGTWELLAHRAQIYHLSDVERRTVGLKAPSNSHRFKFRHSKLEPSGHFSSSKACGFSITLTQSYWV
ncbi:hypothetical protein BDN72DRAFT_588988 [Pluteus cervinus]|uniref:Uncharacterized protein n=1 Tax=Pluteus cervinus TaxID=181527 RepID=A0ACD3A1Z4_9AGAR|nr:hypothetical protein BDN72DRAFT_588988 [Pluteus cervinus]